MLNHLQYLQININIYLFIYIHIYRVSVYGIVRVLSLKQEVATANLLIKALLLVFEMRGKRSDY